MGAGHYSSPGGGGRGRRILVHYDQLDLITPIRLCNIITTPTPLYPAHTHIRTPPPPHTHTHAHTHTHTHKLKNKTIWFFYVPNNIYTLTDPSEHAL